jgi:hypothetical protein
MKLNSSVFVLVLITILLTFGDLSTSTLQTTPEPTSTFTPTSSSASPFGLPPSPQANPFKTQQTAGKKGKCMPIPLAPLASPIYSYSAPACSSILYESGFTHFWATEDTTELPIGTTGPVEDVFSTPCGDSSYYNYVLGTQQLMNVFEEFSPSSTCQSMLVLMSCFVVVPTCDPEIDVDEYLTQDSRKPCPWPCELMRDHLGELCPAEDVQYLKRFGFDLEDRTTVPQMDCDSAYYATHEQENNAQCMLFHFLFEQSFDYFSCIIIVPSIYITISSFVSLFLCKT